MNVVFCAGINIIFLYCFLCVCEKANGYYLDSIKAGGLSPVETISSNRIILSPLPSNQSNKIKHGGKQILVQNFVDRIGYEQLQGKSNLDKGIWNVDKQGDKKNIKRKRDAKSACELRRKPRYIGNN